MACIKITQKNAKESYRVFRVRGCNFVLDWMMKFSNTYFYNSGQYGWNCDIFPISRDVAICIGYRLFGEDNKNIQELAEYFDDELYKVCKSQINFIERDIKREELINSFIAKVLEEACNG